MIVKASFMVFWCVAMAGWGCGSPKKSNGNTVGAPASQAAQQEEVNTLLWEISGNGLKKPSYLFGTMHILCAEDAQLSENLQQIIRNSDVIYFELDMDDMKQMLGALQYLRMADGQKISELLTPEEYARVESYFKQLSLPMPLSLLNRFKPYFLSSLIGERILTCEQKNGMEMQIMGESKKYEKEIKGLETMQFQAGIFDSIPYAKQAKDLVNYIDSIDNYKKVMLEMVDVYRKQDLSRMDSLMHKSDPGLEEYMDLLVYNRNRRWVELMPELMAQQSVLFAVGAGHLPGDQGVISLLRKKGYDVKPMKN